MDGLAEGRIVYFVFGEVSAKQVNLGREHGVARVNAGDRAPAMVVRVWNPSGTVNLKVMLDGPDTFWAQSVDYSEAKAPGSWHWPTPTQATRQQPESAATQEATS